MNITQQEKENRKIRIVYAAYELFCERGIDAVPLRDIAEKAGVSLNSIFRYFETKTALLQATQSILWTEIVAGLLDDSKHRLALARSGFEEMEILLENFRHFYERQSNYILFACEYKLFLIRKHITWQEQFYDEVLAPICQSFKDALVRGRRDGSISQAETVDTQFSLVWSVMRVFVEGIVIYERICADNNPLKDYFSVILARSLESLRPKPGGPSVNRPVGLGIDVNHFGEEESCSKT